MKKIIIAVAALIAVIIICSCSGIPELKKDETPLDPYEAFPPIFPSIDDTPEETQPPKDDGPNPTATPRKVITIKARILEYSKATKVVYINVGTSTKGIKKGLVGKIYNDKALTQENGVVELTKVYPSYAEGLASGQNYEIDPKAAIAVFTIEK